MLRQSSYNLISRECLVPCFIVVLRCGRLGVDDPRSLSVSGSGQLGHHQVPSYWPAYAAAFILPWLPVCFHVKTFCKFAELCFSSFMLFKLAFMPEFDGFIFNIKSPNHLFLFKTPYKIMWHFLIFQVN